jgi:peptidylprolyl isomerase
VHPNLRPRKVAAPLLAVTLLLAACGGGESDENNEAQPQATPTGPADGTATINPDPIKSFGTRTEPGGPKRVPVSEAKFPVVTAGEKFGEDPTIKFEGYPPNDIMFKVLSEGDGPAVKDGEVVVADFRGQVWEEGGVSIPAFENTFETDPVVKRIGRGDVIPAWDLKIPGVKVGSRVLLVTPPATAFGAKGNTGAGILGIDTLAFVIDIIDAFSPAQTPDGTKVTPPKGLPTVEGDAKPTITPPKGDPPKELVSEVLIRGKGEAIKNDQTIAVNYVGVLWKDGKEFDTSWRSDGPSPLGFHLNSAQIIKGWNEGLRGKKIGSRVLLVVPPEMGYGSKGNEAAGIKGTDTLVFVVDILGAY